ncbi:MAG: hypothetical protein ABIP94_15140 [Planctomycetota bacterium]
MTSDRTAVIASVAQPAPPQVRATSAPSISFSGIAALGAVFAGLLSYGRDPDLLTTGFAAGLTFLGALIALHVLRLAFRLAVALGKIAIPAGAILLLGCALHWTWAETAVDWLRVIGIHGVRAAEQGFAAWQGR